MTLLDRPDWHQHAACAGEPPETFFPEQHSTAVAKRAKAICATCSVKAECLAEHLWEMDGIFGGTSPRQRRRLRAGRRLEVA